MVPNFEARFRESLDHSRAIPFTENAWEAMEAKLGAPAPIVTFKRSTVMAYAAAAVVLLFANVLSFTMWQKASSLGLASNNSTPQHFFIANTQAQPHFFTDTISQTKTPVHKQTLYLPKTQTNHAAIATPAVTTSINNHIFIEALNTNFNKGLLNHINTHTAQRILLATNTINPTDVVKRGFIENGKLKTVKTTPKESFFKNIKEKVHLSKRIEDLSLAVQTSVYNISTKVPLLQINSLGAESAYSISNTQLYAELKKRVFVAQSHKTSQGTSKLKALAMEQHAINSSYELPNTQFATTKLAVSTGTSYRFTAQKSRSPYINTGAIAMASERNQVAINYFAYENQRGIYTRNADTNTNHIAIHTVDTEFGIRVRLGKKTQLAHRL